MAYEHRTMSGSRLHEYCAHVGLPKGGSMTVTVKAYDRDDAVKRLMKMGYTYVNGVTG